MNTTNQVQVGDASTTTSTTTSCTYPCPYNRPKAEQGWECPRCGKINAPWKSQCDCSGSNWTITSDWIYRPEWWKTYVTCGQADDTIKNSNIYTVGGSDYKDNMSQVWTNNPHISNKIDPNTATTTWNDGPNTQTIHNGKINYKE